jgi:hypothetical protein
VRGGGGGGGDLLIIIKEKNRFHTVQLCTGVCVCVYVTLICRDLTFSYCSAGWLFGHCQLVAKILDTKKDPTIGKQQSPWNKECDENGVVKL